MTTYKHPLAATTILDSRLITLIASRSYYRTSPQVQELLLLSKNEQTFSGILAQELTQSTALQLDQLTDSNAGLVLLELKGKDYLKRNANGVEKATRNFHDLTIVNNDAEIEVIIENKVWYHFDGAKGAVRGKPEPGIARQIKADIEKIKQTLDGSSSIRRGFILLNILTPGNTVLIPASYKKEHDKAWDRCMHSTTMYREEGLNGIRKVLGNFDADLRSVEIENFTNSDTGGFIDFICAEVILD
jgi:hypothetical protein